MLILTMCTAAFALQKRFMKRSSELFRAPSKSIPFTCPDVVNKCGFERGIKLLHQGAYHLEAILLVYLKDPLVLLLEELVK